MDADLEQPVLSERISDIERSLNNMEGQLFPDPDGSEWPSEILVLGREDHQNGQVQALFIQYWDMLYMYTDGAAQQALENISHGVPPPLPSSTGL